MVDLNLSTSLLEASSFHSTTLSCRMGARRAYSYVAVPVPSTTKAAKSVVWTRWLFVWTVMALWCYLKLFTEVPKYLCKRFLGSLTSYLTIHLHFAFDSITLLVLI